MTATASTRARALSYLGIAAHLVILFWYATTGLVAPTWAVGVLLALWAGLLVVAIVLLRRRPMLVPLVPLVAAVIWFAAVAAGDAFLGWTA